MAVAAIALVAVSAIYSAVSSYQQGQQQKKLAEYNASLAENQAKSARAWGEYNAAKQDQRARIFEAKQRNIGSQMGIDLSEGSPLSIMADTMAQSELEKAAIRYKADVEATNLEGQAAGSRYQGQIAAWAGSQKAFGSILQGAASIASMGAMGAGGSSGLSNSWSQGMQSTFGSEPGSMGRFLAGNSGTSYGAGSFQLPAQ